MPVKNLNTYKPGDVINNKWTVMIVEPGLAKCRDCGMKRKLVSVVNISDSNYSALCKQCVDK